MLVVIVLEELRVKGRAYRGKIAEWFSLSGFIVINEVEAMSEAAFEATVGGIDQGDEFALGEGSRGDLCLNLVDVFVFIDDPVVDQLVLRVSAGTDAGNVRSGGLKFDSGDLDLSGEKVGQVFSTHERRVDDSKLTTDLRAY